MLITPKVEIIFYGENNKMLKDVNWENISLKGKIVSISDIGIFKNY